MLEAFLIGAGIGLWSLLLVVTATASWRSWRDSRPDEPVETEGPPTERWVNDHGEFTVYVLEWDAFRDLVTDGGRVSFAGQGRTVSHYEAMLSGGDTWFEQGNYWHQRNGKVYRCEYPAASSTLGTTWS